MYVCVSYVSTQIPVWIDLYIYMCIYISMYMSIYIYIYIYIHILYIYIYIHDLTVAHAVFLGPSSLRLGRRRPAAAAPRPSGPRAAGALVEALAAALGSHGFRSKAKEERAETLPKTVDKHSYLHVGT